MAEVGDEKPGREMTEAFVMALRRGPATGDLDPFCQTAALLALDIDDVGVAAASAADAVLLDRVWRGPVLVLFDSLLLILGGLFEIRLARQLPGGSVGGTMLDRGVSVTKITEVVDVFDGKESAGRE